MTDDTCSQAGDPLDGSHLSADPMPTRAPQVRPGACHTVTRFGRPSNFSLSRAELVNHVRQLRRAGWQHWEVAVRFDLGRAA